MYRKSVSLLVMLSVMFLTCFCCIRGVDIIRLYTEPAEIIILNLWDLEEKANQREKEWMPQEQLTAKEEESRMGIVEATVSGQRVIDVCVLEQQYVYNLPEEELGTLLRIVEAEAGTEDEEGKLLVANVVLNRMMNEQFPDTVSEVVFQNEKGVAQFSPVSDGAYYQVEISEETMQAVERALLGEDISQGALYFAARKYADRNKMRWFDENLTYLFAHGGHEFFK